MHECGGVCGGCWVHRAGLETSEWKPPRVFRRTGGQIRQECTFLFWFFFFFTSCHSFGFVLRNEVLLLQFLKRLRFSF